MLCGRRLQVFLPNGKGAARGFLPTGQFKAQDLVKVFAQAFSSETYTENEQSFTVSYLISSCGLSPKAAVTASRHVQFRTAEQPDSVIAFLRRHDFTDAQISKLARVRPGLLCLNPSKILLPKLEFFRSLGFPSPELAKTITSNPTMLSVSLEKRIIPIYYFLRDGIRLDDKKIIKAFKNSQNPITKAELGKYIIPKITHLKELGVPAPILSYLFTYYSRVLLQKHDRFERTVKEVVAMGFDPSKITFVVALHVIFGMTNVVEIYQKCGWSKDDFLLAFRIQPLCASLSEKKIRSMMDFFVNKMGLMPAAIAWVPSVLLYSLEKRVIPRCLVIKALVLKGLLKKDMSISTVVALSNKKFLEKFVTKYVADVPQLLKVFQGKCDLDEQGFLSSDICGRKKLVEF